MIFSILVTSLVYDFDCFLFGKILCFLYAYHFSNRTKVRRKTDKKKPSNQINFGLRAVNPRCHLNGMPNKAFLNQSSNNDLTLYREFPEAPTIVQSFVQKSIRITIPTDSQHHQLSEKAHLCYFSFV